MIYQAGSAYRYGKAQNVVYLCSQPIREKGNTMKQIIVMTESHLCLSQSEIEQGLQSTRVDETTYSISEGMQEQHLCPHCGKPVMLLYNWGTYQILCPKCSKIGTILYRDRGGDVFLESIDELAERGVEYMKESDKDCAFEIL